MPTNMTTNQQQCARCGRPAPAKGSGAFLAWEELVDGRVICPACVASQEQQADN